MHTTEERAPAPAVDPGHPIEELKGALAALDTARAAVVNLKSRAGDLEGEITAILDRALALEPGSDPEVAAAEKAGGLQNRLGLMRDRIAVAEAGIADKVEDVLSAGRFTLLALEHEAAEIRGAAIARVGALVAILWSRRRMDGEGRALVLESDAIARVDALTHLPAADRLERPEACAALIECAERIARARAFVDGLKFTTRGL